jgi:hypothetical protein
MRHSLSTFLSQIGRPLSNAQIARLTEFRRYDPGTDFSSIGLGATSDQAARAYASSVCVAHRFQVKPAA